MNEKAMEYVVLEGTAKPSIVGFAERLRPTKFPAYDEVRKFARAKANERALPFSIWEAGTNGWIFVSTIEPDASSSSS
jgi:hypothetical protein